MSDRDRAVEEFIPTLTHATERDIDLLLVEELYASSAFVAWFSAAAGLLMPVIEWSVLHSKRRTRSRREIDIFVTLRHQDGATAALLIENKLDATEQPDQAESYREELAGLGPAYSQVKMMITCPVKSRPTATPPETECMLLVVLAYRLFQRGHDWTRNATSSIPIFRNEINALGDF